MMGDFMERRKQSMHTGLPAPYQGKENPLVYDTEILKKGKDLYVSACSGCHGQNGDGNGPAGENLDPRPANLISTMNSFFADDDFLYWTISEGGVPFKTAMPPFKNIFDEKQIWSIISYLRTFLVPSSYAKADDEGSKKSALIKSVNYIWVSMKDADFFIEND